MTLYITKLRNAEDDPGIEIINIHGKLQTDHSSGEERPREDSGL